MFTKILTNPHSQRDRAWYYYSYSMVRVERNTSQVLKFYYEKTLTK